MKWLTLLVLLAGCDEHYTKLELESQADNYARKLGLEYRAVECVVDTDATAICTVFLKKEQMTIACQNVKPKEGCQKVKAFNIDIGLGGKSL